MCTVTFVPHTTHGFILTSNRDESPFRKTIPPEKYRVKESELVFPKDEVAGGTWFGYNQKDRLICLLNGGFTAHERESEYRMSRGVIVTDLLTSENASETIRGYDFKGIEPFTIIMVEWPQDLRLFELVWDGDAVHFSEKPLAPQIWSSSLLYSEETKRKRETWFSEFLFKTLSPSQDEILEFHKTAGEGDIQTNLIMDMGFVKTKSITSFTKTDEETVMTYEDLETNQITAVAS